MIITLATYKSLTNTTVTTDDAYLNALIPSVCDLVETYCDRHFDLNTYSFWTTISNSIKTDEYPITKLIMAGQQQKVAVLSWPTTSDYAVEIRSDRVVVTNTKNYGFNSDSYLFSDNTTLAALKISIEDDWDITVAIESGYTDFNTALLKTGTDKTWYGAIRYSANYRIQDNTIRFMQLEDALEAQFGFDSFIPNCFYVCYQAGYAYSDMPKGLQLVVSNIVKDILNLSKMGGKGMMKSESITNYSYTNWNPSEYDIKNIINNYADGLDPWRKKSV